MTKKIYPKSRILSEIHETAADMYDLGFISHDEMLEFDALCLDKVPTYSPAFITGLRNKWKLSQSAFANVINARESTVQKWESGVSKPSAAVNKLLHILQTKGLHALM